MISSQRLTYCDLGPEHADAMHEIVSFWEVTRELGSWPWPPEIEFTRSRCDPSDKEGFFWAIFLGDEMIGSVGVRDWGLGYNLHPDHWGKGYISEAAVAAINHHFTITKADTIPATAWADNLISQHVLKKLGFVECGRGSEVAKARGVETGFIDFTLTREAWSARNPLRNSADSITRKTNSVSDPET